MGQAKDSPRKVLLYTINQYGMVIGCRVKLRSNFNSMKIDAIKQLRKKGEIK
jgi:hypothetical protein